VILTAIALAMSIARVKTVQLQAQDSKAKVTLSKNAKQPAGRESKKARHD
jgi:hypothetical protein